MAANNLLRESFAMSDTYAILQYGNLLEITFPQALVMVQMRSIFTVFAEQSGEDYIFK